MVPLSVVRKPLADGTTVVGVNGELDLHTAPALHGELAAAIAERTSRVVVDLTHCGFLDSTALSLLVNASRELGHPTERLTLVIPDKSLLRVFEVTGCDRYFHLHTSLEEVGSHGAGG